MLPNTIIKLGSCCLLRVSPAFSGSRDTAGSASQCSFFQIAVWRRWTRATLRLERNNKRGTPAIVRVPTPHHLSNEGLREGLAA